MGIQQNITGTADNDSICSIQISRVPDSGDLRVKLVYRAGTTKMLKLTPSEAFKASIEATYSEIKAAINAAEGLS